jgi:Tol biopolymer transport system component
MIGKHLGFCEHLHAPRRTDSPTRALPFLSLLSLVALTACGTGGTTSVTPAPAAKPQIVYTGPGVPGQVAVQQLYTANLDGSNIVEPPQDNLNKFLTHFSPDGTRLVYTKFLSGKFGDLAPTSDIFTYNLATSTETQLTHTGTAIMAAWSPTGQQIAFGTYAGTGLYIMNADGTSQHLVGAPSGASDDIVWHDFAWAGDNSSDNWVYFVVEQNTNNCLKVRLDKVRPDGTSRTQVSDGGPNCTPPNMEPYGDADPGISADGSTVYSSRGLAPLPADHTQTLRHLYTYSTSAYTPGKVESDLSIAMKPDCTVGVPKGSPDGKQILTFLFCPDDQQHVGVTLTDTSGSFWTYIVKGFGPDWNPTTNP